LPHIPAPFLCRHEGLDGSDSRETESVYPRRDRRLHRHLHRRRGQFGGQQCRVGLVECHARAGATAGTATTAANCNAIGKDTWRLEALGQTFFSFGTDSNNAHVQPTGAYRYHGMPEGPLTFLGVSSASPRMVLIGWARDGHPIYARYGRTVATDAGSALKAIRSSYGLKTTPDAGRPSTISISLGVFLQDYQYVAGSCGAGPGGLAPDARSMQPWWRKHWSRHR